MTAYYGINMRDTAHKNAAHILLKSVAEKLLINVLKAHGIYWEPNVYYLAPSNGVKYCDQCVCMTLCMSVCLYTYLENHMSKFHKIF